MDRGRITSRVPFRMPQQQKKKRKREECRRTSGAEPVCSWAQVEKICDCHREMESYLIIDTAYVWIWRRSYLGWGASFFNGKWNFPWEISSGDWFLMVLSDTTYRRKRECLFLKVQLLQLSHRWPKHRKWITKNSENWLRSRSPAEPTPSLSAEPPVRLRPCPMRSIWMPSNIPWKK